MSPLLYYLSSIVCQHHAHYTDFMSPLLYSLPLIHCTCPNVLIFPKHPTDKFRYLHPPQRQQLSWWRTWRSSPRACRIFCWRSQPGFWNLRSTLLIFSCRSEEFKVAKIQSLNNIFQKLEQAMIQSTKLLIQVLYIDTYKISISSRAHCLIWLFVQLRLWG